MLSFSQQVKKLVPHLWPPLPFPSRYIYPNLNASLYLTTFVTTLRFKSLCLQGSCHPLRSTSGWISLHFRFSVSLLWEIKKSADVTQPRHDQFRFKIFPFLWPWQGFIIARFFRINNYNDCKLKWQHSRKLFTDSICADSAITKESYKITNFPLELIFNPPCELKAR